MRRHLVQLMGAATLLGGHLAEPRPTRDKLSTGPQPWHPVLSLDPPMPPCPWLRLAPNATSSHHRCPAPRLCQGLLGPLPHRAAAGAGGVCCLAMAHKGKHHVGGCRRSSVWLGGGVQVKFRAKDTIQARVRARGTVTLSHSSTGEPELGISLPGGSSETPSEPQRGIWTSGALLRRGRRVLGAGIGGAPGGSCGALGRRGACVMSASRLATCSLSWCFSREPLGAWSRLQIRGKSPELMLRVGIIVQS